MPLSVAEYLGQRTDIESSEIIPSELGGKIIPTCPFSGAPCRKLKLSKPQPPICAVRTSDVNQQGKVFVVCPDRIIPSSARALSPSHLAILNAVTKTIFPGVNNADIGFRRQVNVTFAKARRLVLDYVLQVAPGANASQGPRKVILEVQGGGETSSTGAITAHVAHWASLVNPANAVLATPLDTAYLRQQLHINSSNVPGVIPNNAWKRQLDQVLKKAALTTHFGGAFALVMGELLYDYVTSTLDAGRPFFSDWQIGLLCIAETPSNSPGPIRLEAVSKAIFMTYGEFIAALQNFSVAADTPNPFSGEFITLRNKSFQVT